MAPQISIVMLVYNSSLYLRETIEGVLQQTFKDFEFIIVDDGSTDDSVNTIKRYRDDRIKLYQFNHDYIYSLNYGMRSAIGRYIVRIDPSDIMLPHRLRTQYDYMEVHGDVAACGSWVQTFGKEENVYRLDVEYGNILSNMLISNPIYNSSVIMRSEFLKVHFYNKGKEVYDRSYIYAEDYYLWYNIVSQGGRIANINEVLLMYRYAETSRKRTDLLFRSAVKARFQYLKYVCNSMATRDSEYISSLMSLWELLDYNRISFDLLCYIVKLLYRNYLTSEAIANHTR